VNRMVWESSVWGSLSFVEFTEVSMVDVDRTADEADTDGDVVDLDVIDAMAKR
jgi:hypothetical protein